MEIQSATLQLHAAQRSETRHERHSQLRVWRAAAEGRAAPAPAAQPRISEAARQALAQSPAPASCPPPRECGATSEIAAAAQEAEADPTLALVRQLLEWLTGRKIRLLERLPESPPAELDPPAVDAHAAPRPSPAPAWGFEFTLRNVYEETEHSSFSVTGIVRTEDGREISLSLHVAMSRAYRQETHLTLRAGAAERKDPLVVNFAGTAVELAAALGQRFRFDLDGDGTDESLPLLGAGSGFLALDHDDNGRIDSGRELFGPQSGRGFTELARLDEDGNGWIDARDAAFARLKVWQPAAEGPGTLRSLADLGIGALALAHLATPFALRGPGNTDLGQVKASGFYLRLDGEAGSLQEIDLTV